MEKRKLFIDFFKKSTKKYAHSVVNKKKVLYLQANYS